MPQNVKLIITISLILSTIFAQNYWTQVGSDIDGEAANDASGYAVSLSSDGTRLAIGAFRNDGTGTDAGHVRVYSESGGVWTQVGADIDGEAAGDFSGWSVALSSDGTRLAISARENDGGGANAGHVRVYSESGGVWTQVGSDIDGETAGDQLGWSVALSSDGTRVAIGAPYNDGTGTSAGHVRVYDESGGTWTQVGADIDGEAASDNSGYSVSLSSDGTRVAIGAYLNDGTGTDAGHVRVYSESGGVWTQVGADIDGEAVGDLSGLSVALSSDGRRVAIGAYLNDGTDTNAGHVRVYSESSGAWTQVGSDIDGEAVYDYSGISVSLSSDGTRVAIGAQSNDGTGTDAGHVRIYYESSGTWTQIGSDIDGEAAGDNSGRSVAISSDGTRVAIGAQSNDGTGTDAGHARVYGLPEINLKQSTTDIADGGSYDYGSKALGTDTDIVFTIENTGTANLTITTPLTIGGTDASQFSITSQPATATILASSSTTFTVRFSPTSTGAKTASISIANDDSDENPYNLTLNGTVAPVSISGHVKDADDNAIEGVGVAFSNGGATVYTDVNGMYITSVSPGWGGTATPTKSGWVFTPISIEYTVATTNQVDQNYIGTFVPSDHTISGFVRDDTGNGLEGVAVVFDNGGATVYTNQHGWYITSVSRGWSGTCSPSMEGYEFSPDYISFTNVDEDLIEQDFLAQSLLGINDVLDNLPTTFTVLPAHPNPFNPTTTITYGLENNSKVEIRIYDISGKLITTLLNTEQTQGWHSIEWNGTDSNLNQVPAGIYLSRITSDNTTKTAKLLLLR